MLGVVIAWEVAADDGLFPEAGVDDGCATAAGEAPGSTKAAVGFTRIASLSCSWIAFELTVWFSMKLPTFGTAFEVIPISRQVV